MSSEQWAQRLMPFKTASDVCPADPKVNLGIIDSVAPLFGNVDGYESIVDDFKRGLSGDVYSLPEYGHIDVFDVLSDTHSETDVDCVHSFTADVPFCVFPFNIVLELLMKIPLLSLVAHLSICFLRASCDEVRPYGDAKSSAGDKDSEPAGNRFHEYQSNEVTR